MRTLGPEVLAIAEQIKPILAGREPMIQSAVLAELLSLLLAGHWIAGEPKQTEMLRKSILSAHCILVWELLEINAHILETDK